MVVDHDYPCPTTGTLVVSAYEDHCAARAIAGLAYFYDYSSYFVTRAGI